jgi:hypothetical protein
LLHRCPREAIRECFAGEQLHDEEQRPMVVADVVERASMRMRELRDRARLCVESLLELDVGYVPLLT